MTMNLVEDETFAAGNTGDRPLAVRVVAITLSILMALARRVVEEISYTIGEDLGHGQISRNQEDWERD
jgi:hypothetical protein